MNLSQMKTNKQNLGARIPHLLNGEKNAYSIADNKYRKCPKCEEGGKTVVMERRSKSSTFICQICEHKIELVKRVAKKTKSGIAGLNNYNKQAIRIRRKMEERKKELKRQRDASLAAKKKRKEKKKRKSNDRRRTKTK